MLDIAPTEMLLVALVALVVIGPKDLPRVMRTVGGWVARARGMARHFRSGLDEMVRQAELEELEKKWKTENERILREHPPETHYPDPHFPEAGDAAATGEAPDRRPAAVMTPLAPPPAPDMRASDQPMLPLDAPHGDAGKPA